MNNFDNINLFANLKDDVILKYLTMITDDNNNLSSKILVENNKIIKEEIKDKPKTLERSKEMIAKLKSNYRFMANKSNLGLKITEIKDTTFSTCASICNDDVTL